MSLHTLNVKIRSLNQNAKTPTYGTDGSACFDLYAARIECDGLFEAEIGTGIAFEIPDGHVLMIYPRSGLARKHGVRLKNTTGVIDSDYRGEVILMMEHHSDWTPQIGDKVAQAMVIPVPRVTFEWAEALSETERGAGGFGSTGA